jgi:hypothetical protein
MLAKKSNGAKIKHHKQRGEWVELRFMAMAAEHGLMVSKPYGDSASYDFIVEHDGQCLRVQVKSTMFKRQGAHYCQVRGSQRRPYVDSSFDFVAIYLILADVWYIIPTGRIAGQTSLFLNPNDKHAKYAHYQEAWHLLSENRTIDRIHACAEDFIPVGSEHLVT